jgi:hypothetical protein
MVKCLIMFFLLPGIQSQTNATQKNASALGICLIMVCRFFWDTVQTNPVFTLYLFDKKEPKSNAKQFVPCQFGSIWSPLHLIDIPGGNRGRDQWAKLQGSDSESYDWHHHNLGKKRFLAIFLLDHGLCTNSQHHSFKQTFLPHRSGWEDMLALRRLPPPWAQGPQLGCIGSSSPVRCFLKAMAYLDLWFSY